MTRWVLALHVAINPNWYAIVVSTEEWTMGSKNIHLKIELTGPLSDHYTPLESGYQSLLIALRWMLENIQKGDTYRIACDNAQVVNQIKGTWKSPLIVYQARDKARELMDELKFVSEMPDEWPFHWVSESDNMPAIELALREQRRASETTENT